MADAPQSKLIRAWERLRPLSCGFATARLSRLWLVQSIVALICAASLVWMVRHCWFPVIREAIEHAPDFWSDPSRVVALERTRPRSAG